MGSISSTTQSTVNDNSLALRDIGLSGSQFVDAIELIVGNLTLQTQAVQEGRVPTIASREIITTEELRRLVTPSGPGYQQLRSGADSPLVVNGLVPPSNASFLSTEMLGTQGGVPGVLLVGGAILLGILLTKGNLL